MQVGPAYNAEILEHVGNQEAGEGKERGGEGGIEQRNALEKAPAESVTEAALCRRMGRVEAHLPSPQCPPPARCEKDLVP